MIEIPVKDFDQAKLEFMLQNTPAAYVREENQGKFLRKYYQYPNGHSPFLIKCYADHYNDSPISSSRKCSMTTSGRLSGDEVKFDYSDSDLPRQKIYSLERVYGQSFEGKYRELFRYVIDCTKAKCQMTFAVKAATP